MDQTKAHIRAAARHLGFTLCGFARVEPLLHEEFVGQWLSAGKAAGMSYIERHLAQRLDPRLVLPDAQTIITVG